MDTLSPRPAPARARDLAEIRRDAPRVIIYTSSLALMLGPLTPQKEHGGLRGGGENPRPISSRRDGGHGRVQCGAERLAERWL